jgi:integrase
MSVKLRTRKQKDGSTKLWLDIYNNGDRWSETLKNLLLVKPVSSLDREANKETLRLAKIICAKKSAELEASNYSIHDRPNRSVIVTDWMDSYIKQYAKKDVRNLQRGLSKFTEFLISIQKEKITFDQLNPILIESYQGFLENCSVGEGAHTTYTRTKKMIKHAYRIEVTNNDVLSRVTRKIRGKAREKDILTITELEQVMKTPMNSPVVRQAAIFSAMTGLAWCDVRGLLWSEIDFQNKELRYIRDKQTAYQNIVTVPLNDTALSVLPAIREPEELVFELPSHTGAGKSLRNWVKRAGVDKHITWHCLRHSFGTNIMFLTGDLLTTSKLLGHMSFRHTGRYVRESEKLKKSAIDLITLKKAQ